MIRIVVVDDQAIVRDGLVTVLGLVEGLEIVGEAGDGEAGVRLVTAVRPHVVLMDLRMPILDGVGATAQLTEQCSQTAVLVLTTHADDGSILRALRAGARGYLTKDAGRKELEAAIRAVAAGQTILANEISRRVIGGLGAGAPADVARPSDAHDLRRRYPTLTHREAEVLTVLAAGRSNAEIAADLFISGATVKSHVNAIYSKLQTTTRAETIALLLG